MYVLIAMYVNRRMPLCRINDDDSPMLPPKRRGVSKGFNLEDGTTSEDDGDTVDMSLFLKIVFQDHGKPEVLFPA